MIPIAAGALGAYGGVVARTLAKQAVQQLVINTVFRLIERTPVRTGRMQRAWKVHKGKPLLASALEGEVSPSALGDLELGDVVYIVNDVPYAVFVEFGTLHQYAAHIVGNTVVELALGAVLPPRARLPVGLGLGAASAGLQTYQYYRQQEQAPER